MKKFIVSFLCITLCLPILGCVTTSDETALNTLNNQLDRVQNVVSSTSSTEVNSVSPYVANIDKDNQLSLYKAEAYYNMTNEEELRQEVLSLTKTLKNKTNKYKLGNKKASALNALSTNLSKYINYLSNTKSEVKNNVNKINKNTKPESYNEDIIKSSYNSLSNLMNERIVYLGNIYNSLSQIQDILDNSKINTTPKKVEVESNNTSNNTECKDCDNKENSSECEDCKQNSNTNTNKTASRRFQPNIDTYGANRRNYYNKNSNNQTETTKNSDNESTDNFSKNNITEYPNEQPYQTTPFTPQVPNNGNVYNNANGYPNQFYGYYPYNNYQFYRFNPGRNTDSFYPFMRNIDTYRLSPSTQGYNGGLGYNQNMATPPLSQTASVDNELNGQIEPRTDDEVLPETSALENRENLEIAESTKNSNSNIAKAEEIKRDSEELIKNLDKQTLNDIEKSQKNNDLDEPQRFSNIKELLIEKDKVKPIENEYHALPMPRKPIEQHIELNDTEGKEQIIDDENKILDKEKITISKHKHDKKRPIIKPKPLIERKPEELTSSPTLSFNTCLSQDVKKEEPERHVI